MGVPTSIDLQPTIMLESYFPWLSDANKKMGGETGIGGDYSAPVTPPLVGITDYCREMWQESETWQNFKGAEWIVLIFNVLLKASYGLLPPYAIFSWLSYHD